MAAGLERPFQKPSLDQLLVNPDCNLIMPEKMNPRHKDSIRRRKILLE